MGLYELLSSLLNIHHRWWKFMWHTTFCPIFHLPSLSNVGDIQDNVSTQLDKIYTRSLIDFMQECSLCSLLQVFTHITTDSIWERSYYLTQSITIKHCNKQRYHELQHTAHLMNPMKNRLNRYHTRMESAKKKKHRKICNLFGSKYTKECKND